MQSLGIGFQLPAGNTGRKKKSATLQSKPQKREKKIKIKFTNKGPVTIRTAVGTTPNTVRIA